MLLSYKYPFWGFDVNMFFNVFAKDHATDFFMASTTQPVKTDTYCVMYSVVLEGADDIIRVWVTFYFTGPASS